MTCSLSSPSSLSFVGNEWGKPNMKRAEQKSKAPHSRKPTHQAPIHRGLSGVMLALPAERPAEISALRGTEDGRGAETAPGLTAVDEDSVHVELCAEGAQNEAAGRSKHQRRKEDPCTQAFANLQL